MRRCVTRKTVPTLPTRHGPPFLISPEERPMAHTESLAPSPQSSPSLFSPKPSPSPRIKPTTVYLPGPARRPRDGTTHRCWHRPEGKSSSSHPPTPRTVSPAAPGRSAVDQLTCKDPFGGTRTYKSQEIAALITPDDEDVEALVPPWVQRCVSRRGLHAAVATCIPCAVATGVVAGIFFFA